MVIGVSDPDNFTFSQQLINHWESLGHTVKKSLYHEESFTETCDVVFYDFASMNVGELAKFGKKPKRCVVRAIDVENYNGYHEQFNYDLIDSFIFLNKSQHEMMREKGFSCPEEKVEIIAPGIDLKKYTLKPKSTSDTIKLVFVGRLWIGKAVLGALDVAEAWEYYGKKVELHICGTNFDPNWWRKLVEYRVETSKVPVHFYNRVDDMNEFLDDKDVMIVPSYKEAFSYVSAEALAKGLIVFHNDWYGSHSVWPDYLIYRQPHQTISMYEDIKNMDPKELRRIVERKYDEEIMFRKIDKLMGL